MNSKQIIAADFIKAFPALEQTLRDHIDKLTVASLKQDGLLECFNELMKLESKIEQKKESVYKPAMVGGKRYFICMENGYTFHRKEDGGYGNWAGIFSKSPKCHIDTSIPEPKNLCRVVNLNSEYWINDTTRHAYHRNKDGSFGNWAGIFYNTPTPHIDTSVEEPDESDEDNINLEF